MTPNDNPATLAAVPTTDPYGRACLGVPLTGRDGEGRYVLIDEEGLAKLCQRGARALYVVNDGHGREYVKFVARRQAGEPRSSGQYRTITAARAILGDPRGARIEFVTGNRLDLRRANLRARAYEGVGEAAA